MAGGRLSEFGRLILGRRGYVCIVALLVKRSQSLARFLVRWLTRRQLAYSSFKGVVVVGGKRPSHIFCGSHTGLGKQKKRLATMLYSYSYSYLGVDEHSVGQVIGTCLAAGRAGF